MAEIRLNRELRNGELLWKQSSAAAESLDAMEDDVPAANAMIMLDWDGREYKTETGARHVVTYSALDRALQAKERSTIAR